MEGFQKLVKSEIEVNYPIPQYPCRRDYPHLPFPFWEASHRNIFESRSTKNMCSSWGVNLQMIPQWLKYHFSTYLLVAQETVKLCYNTEWHKESIFLVLLEEGKISTTAEIKGSKSFSTSSVPRSIIDQLRCKENLELLTSLTLGGHLNPATVPVITLFTVLDSGIVRSWEDMRKIREFTTWLSSW